MSPNGTSTPIPRDTNLFKVGRVLWHGDDFTIAESVRDMHGNSMIGVTWNPSPERPRGYPNARGYQQWFVLPEPLAKMCGAANDLEQFRYDAAPQDR